MRSVAIVPSFMNPIGTYFRLLEETNTFAFNSILLYELLLSFG